AKRDRRVWNRTGRCRALAGSGSLPCRRGNDTDRDANDVASRSEPPGPHSRSLPWPIDAFGWIRLASSIASEPPWIARGGGEAWEGEGGVEAEGDAGKIREARARRGRVGADDVARATEPEDRYGGRRRPGNPVQHEQILAPAEVHDPFDRGFAEE